MFCLHLSVFDISLLWVMNDKSYKWKYLNMVFQSDMNVYLKKSFFITNFCSMTTTEKN